MRKRVFSRALAVSAVAALGAAGVAGAMHASAVSARTAAQLAAKAPAKPYDFNGDGYPDLALGSPYGKVSGHAGAGFVSIVYGSKSGVNTSKKKVISQNTSCPSEVVPRRNFVDGGRLFGTTRRSSGS